MISTTSSSKPSYYEILGLNEKNCNLNDIKKAYRKMALRWHPDKNPANHEEAVTRFEKISEAYQILSNSQARETYDRLRCFASAVEGNSSIAEAPSGDGSVNRLADDLSHVVHLKPAQQVFEGFFGGRNPFDDDMFGCGSSVGDSDLLQSKNGTTDSNQKTPSRRWYPCLDTLRQPTPPSEKVFSFSAFADDDSRYRRQCQSDPIHSPANSSPVSSCVRHVSTSTRISNGKKIVIRRVSENGVETVTVEENGKLVKKTVNGSSVDIDTDTSPVSSSASVEMLTDSSERHPTEHVTTSDVKDQNSNALMKN